jgi:hypothetical protein
MAGTSKSLQASVPNFSRASAMPATVPGMPTERCPVFDAFGIISPLASRNMVFEARPGAVSR